ncbi:(2Fe-2S) ferredoxin domain-containing protein [Pontibacter sp. G13]|uniref:(2Fe-2S) ferredoxin domain-containing protein n=1 Tax=Pontibacter sp. G13 TaxID=3074898 RepID=UPI0028897BBD|nr:(2Fe-2S) ferredoxin domain-containing protein [Pontibacter sp. G13]WNJ16635.1 (2Fe-2S) ferredoxin domain-containing protein [Pontibacter sp. G13]
MEPISTTLHICHSVKPKVKGAPGCGHLGAAELLETCQREINLRGWQDQVKAQPGACMRNCEHGVTVRVLHDLTLYGPVQPSDLPEILDSHIGNHQPVKRLQSTPGGFW